jgi:hypothetical protein
MNRFDGNLARQLDLLPAAEPTAPTPVRHAAVPARPNFKLLKRDVYAELLRRRRRAQIAARHALERAEEM